MRQDLKDILDIQRIEDFLIKIEDLSRIEEKVVLYHPDDPRYVDYWRGLKKKCIEGFWIDEFGKKRFVPGRLYFYRNFCTILDVDQVQNTRVRIQPDIRDVEWLRAYMLLVAEGFSGWSKDDEFTSDIILKELNQEELDSIKLVQPERYSRLLNSKGELKKYKEPWENVTELKDKDLGVAHYWNNAKNIIELGARGGGKSFWAALAISKYELVFNGLKYYNEETLKKSTPKAEVCIGSSRTDKSSDLVKKIVDSMEELASNPEFGTWGKVGDEDYTPSPFFKEMTGSYKPNNKDNLWRHEYQVNSNGNWRIKGSGSYLAHVTYSTQKKDGAEVAAGGRYGKLLYEEVGLIELLEEAYQSNKATVTVEGKQFGVQAGLGTSGNMETIIPAKKWFLNPGLFDTVEFEDIYENSTTKIGFFLPAFLTHRGFKDKNGNTNVKEAIKHYLKRREKYIRAKDAKGLEGEMMNYPIVPSEMFLTGDNNRLPIAEISDHIRDLNLTDTFHEYATVGELVFSSKEPAGVVFKPDNKAQLQPITTYPLQKGIPQDGAFVVYEHPITDASGITPKDLYIIGHDPVAKDQTTNQGSFASIFVLKTAIDPIKYGYYELVAEYIGRPFEGREQVNELLEKIAMYYGVSNGMVFFENQVGNVVEYFRKRNKLHLLATQPQKVMNSRGTYTNSITYGYPMSNRIIKDNAIDYLADWLKEPRILGLESNDTQKNKMNLNFIKSPRLLAEFMSYNDKDNFDSVMGFLGCIIGVREKFNQYKDKDKEKEKQDRINNIIDEFKKDDFILNRRYEQNRKHKQGNQPFTKNFLQG